MEKKRAVGLTVLGVFFILSSCFTAITFMFFLRLTSKNPLLMGAAIVWSVVVLFTGIGLIQLKSWARLTAIALVAILTIRNSISSIHDINTMLRKSLLQKNIVLILGLLVTGFIIVLGIGIIYYLTRPKVKEQFK